MKSYYTLLILLTILVTPIVLLAQWDTVDEELKCKEFKTEIDKRGDEQVPVFDESNVAVNTITATVMESLWEKECILDVKVRAQAREVLDNIMQDTIQYLTTGFSYTGPGETEHEDLPYYVQNVNVYLTDISIREQELIVQTLGEPDSLTAEFEGSYFINDLKETLQQEPAGYNLNETVSDVDAFTKGDVTKGGMEGWFSFTQNPYNNPIGSYFIARQEIQNAQQAVQAEELRHLDWGEGTLPTRDDEGNVTQPASVNRDLLTAVTNSGIESLQSTDEVGEIRDREAEVLYESIAEDTPLSEIVVDASDGYDVGDGLSAGSLNIPDSFDIDIFDDIFDLQELLDELFGGRFDGLSGELRDLVEDLIDEDGTFEDFLVALGEELGGGFDPNALLEQFDIVELVEEFSLEEIVDAFGIEALIDQYGLERMIDEFGVQRLIQQAGGLDDLMEGLDRGQLRDLLEADGMNADFGSGEGQIDTLDELRDFLRSRGVTWESLSSRTQDNLASLVRN